MKMRGQPWLPIYLGVGIKKNISLIIQVETLYSSFLSCKNISDQETAKIFCQLKCNCNIRYCAQFFWWFQCGNTWWNQWSRRNEIIKTVKFSVLSQFQKSFLKENEIMKTKKKYNSPDLIWNPLKNSNWYLWMYSMKQQYNSITLFWAGPVQSCC